jgi:hypothetical protein
MRFMVIVKASAASEAGAMPPTELLEAMGKFNEEMVKAGVMVGGDGLHSSARGARIEFDGDRRHIARGPFPDTEHLVAGYWLIDVASLEDAIGWMKRCPNPHPDQGRTHIEIRQIIGMEDFGEALTPELREQEERLRAAVADA